MTHEIESYIDLLAAIGRLPALGMPIAAHRRYQDAVAGACLTLATVLLLGAGGNQAIIIMAVIAFLPPLVLPFHHAMPICINCGELYCVLDKTPIHAHNHMVTCESGGLLRIRKRSVHTRRIVFAVYHAYRRTWLFMAYLIAWSYTRIRH